MDDAAFTRKQFFRLGFSRAAGSVAGALLGCGAVASHALRPRVRPSLVRPPGALPEPAFLDTCTRCDECVKACPHWVVKKGGPELGPRYAGTPVLVPAENPCLFCEDLPCVRSCPTGALAGTTDPASLRIGLAEVDLERCYSAKGQPCDYCQVHCPTSPRAIRVASPGAAPRVDPDACNGCGKCAQICPPSAIRIRPLS
mgnify:CR=1 FL=1